MLNAMAVGRCKEWVAVLDAGMAEAAGAAPAFLEFLHNLELGLRHRHEHHLRDAVAGVDGERRLSAVPAGDEYLSLVIGVDQADQVAEHDAVLVAEAGARQQHGREPGITDVDGDAGGYELRAAPLGPERRVAAGDHIEAGGAPGAR